MHRRLLAAAAVVAFLTLPVHVQSPAAQTTPPLLPSPLSRTPQTGDPQTIDRQPLAPPPTAPQATVPQAVAPPPIEWEEIVGADGRYRLQMPDDYQYLEAQPQPGGAMFRQYSVAYPGRFGFQLMISDSPANEDGANYWLSRTDQILVTANRALLDSEKIKSVGKVITAPAGFRVWTDDFNNLMTVLK